MTNMLKHIFVFEIIITHGHADHLRHVYTRAHAHTHSYLPYLCTGVFVAQPVCALTQCYNPELSDHHGRRELASSLWERSASDVGLHRVEGLTRLLPYMGITVYAKWWKCIL